MGKFASIVAWIGGCGLVLWAVLFGSFWEIRNGCAGGNMAPPRCDGSPIVDWLGNVVMLGWVKDYQTLVGGMLALAGGAFVLVAATYVEGSRDKQQQLYAMRRARAGMALVRSAFHESILAYRLRRPSLAPPVRERIVSACSEIASVDTGLAETMLILAKFTDLGLKEFEESLALAPGLNLASANVFVREGYVNAQAASHFLTDTARLFTSTGFYDHKKLPGRQLAKLLAEDGLEMNSPVLLMAMYDFD